jgi:hypothetical protein
MNFAKFIYQIFHWESWDWRVKYIPIVPSWVWYCFRSRAFWYFTPSNPGLVFGGFDGVSKSKMYQYFPEGSYPKTFYIKHSVSFNEVLSIVSQSQFSFPFIVKPDVGRMGLMFRIIRNTDDLRQYHQCMQYDYLIQEYIKYPLEVSVFYYRLPSQTKGRITGFIKKEYLSVTGDGQSTLLDLINNCPRARFRQKELISKHKDQLNLVVPEAEVFHLSEALNLSRGGKLVHLEKEKDEQLLKIFDELSLYTKELFYGRYDIKCNSIEELKLGKNFCILEFNGAGGEPHHVYGNNYTLLQANIILSQHWDALYRISKENKQRGFNYWKFKEGLDYFLKANKQVSHLKKLDQQLQVWHLDEPVAKKLKTPLHINPVIKNNSIAELS